MKDKNLSMKLLKKPKVQKQKSEAIIKDKEKKIEQTKHDAKSIIVDKTDEVKAKKSALASEAQQKAVNTIDLS